MKWDPEEKEMKELLEQYQVKKPPEDLMRNYVAEVRGRIDAAPQESGMGVPLIVLGLLLGLGMVGVLILSPMKKETPQKAGEEVSLSVPEKASVARETSSQAEQVLFDQVADDLFVLEMLGEDEGIIDDTSRVEMDLQVFAVS